MDQSIDTISVKWRSPYKKLVNDNSKGPQVNSVIVWKFLN